MWELRQQGDSSTAVPRRALITGITGQDGSYLAELLLSKGYEVIGMVRRSSIPNNERIAHILHRLHIVTGDLLDQVSMIEILRTYQPDEVYNLAAQSFVQTSFSQPILTSETTALGVTRMLDAIRLVDPDIRFYQASSSEMFGKAIEVPQSEQTPFHPRSPYGVAKAYGHWITVNFREAYGLHATSGILFNHESPRRGMEFVTRKISHAAASIKLGLTQQLRLGNLESQRDWGYAADYVEAMWRMLQQDEPDDYVICTGHTHSVRALCTLAFEYVGLDYRDHVVVDQQLMRPAEVDLLVGDASKAEARLKWRPTTSFADLVRLMVDADLALLQEPPPRASQTPSTASQSLLAGSQTPFSGPQPPSKGSQPPLTGSPTPLSGPQQPLPAGSQPPIGGPQTPFSGPQPPSKGSQPPLTGSPTPLSGPQQPLPAGSQPPIGGPQTPFSGPQPPSKGSQPPLTGSQTPLSGPATGRDPQTAGGTPSTHQLGQ